MKDVSCRHVFTFLQRDALTKDGLDFVGVPLRMGSARYFGSSADVFKSTPNVMPIFRASPICVVNLPLAVAASFESWLTTRTKLSVQYPPLTMRTEVMQRRGALVALCVKSIQRKSKLEVCPFASWRWP